MEKITTKDNFNSNFFRGYTFTPATSEKLLQDIQGIKLSTGSNPLRLYYAGKKIKRTQAMSAKCCECMSYYEDGKKDCENQRCPLYPWMPYKRKNHGHGNNA